VRPAAIAALVALAGCPNGTPTGNGPPLSDPHDTDDPLTRIALLRDLEAEVLDGYDRDEPLDSQVRVIDATIGGARIGVGPGDVWVGPEVGLGTSRWPLATDRTTELYVRSKKLDVHMADDESAAWVSDEVSWRIVACDRIAMIPLRFTALYVRDGDRWTSVVEHLSYARAPDGVDKADVGARVDPAVGDPEVATAVDEALAPLLAAARPARLAISPEAFALGPQVWDELRADELAVTPLFPGDLTVEHRRLGVVTRTTGKGTVAYWVGTLHGATPAGPVRLRATFVLERAAAGWSIAQAHLSLPIDDPALAEAAFGGALAGLNPLRVRCSAR
jgi:hypothetical protein